MGLPGGSNGKESACNVETWVQSLGGEVSPEKEMQPISVFFPGEVHGQRSLVGYSPWGHKEWDITEQPTQCTLKYL